jgi:hypothetical protein
MSAILRYTLWRNTTLIPERNRPRDAQNEGTNICRRTQHVGLLLNSLYLVGSSFILKERLKQLKKH